MSDQNPCSGPSCAPQLKFYQAFTFATPIIFTLVLLLLFCVLYVRRRQTARAVSQLRAQFFARGFPPWPADHGLTKSFRATLPTIVFDEEFAAARGNNVCSICLGDYQLGEKLQQLPGCEHVFHVHCIDGWLVNSSTCPICRGSLLNGKLEVGQGGDHSGSGSSSSSSQENRGNRPVVIPGAESSSSRNASTSSSSSSSTAAVAAATGSHVIELTTADTVPAAADAAAAAAATPRGEILPEKAAAAVTAQDLATRDQDQAHAQARQATEGPSQRTIPSMEEAVKDSAEQHSIQIER